MLAGNNVATNSSSQFASSRIICAPFVSFCDCHVKSKSGRIRRVKHWEIIADNLSKAGWSWGYVSAVDSEGRRIWIADAHRGDGKRFVVRADEKLTAFVELESAIVSALAL